MPYSSNQEVEVVYGLVDPVDMQLKYVGKTGRPAMRFSQHKSDARRYAKGGAVPCEPLCQWMAEVQASGAEPIMVILAEIGRSSTVTAEREITQVLSYWGDLINERNSRTGIKVDLEQRALKRIIKEALSEYTQENEQVAELTEINEKRQPVTAA